MFFPTAQILNYGQIINRQHPLNRGLASEWVVLPARGKSNTLFDIAGKNHGTLTNGPTWQGPLDRPGGFGCLDCGTTGYVNCGSNASLDNLGPMTLAAWVFMPFTATTEPIIFKKGTFWTFASSESATIWKIRFFLDGSGGDIVASSTEQTALLTDRWVHVMMTWTGVMANDACKFYIDGKDYTDTSTGAGTAKNDSAAALTLGNLSASTEGISLDSCQIWNRALSASEVLQLYNESRLGNPTRWNWIRRRVYAVDAGGGGGAAIPVMMHHYMQQGAA